MNIDAGFIYSVLATNNTKVFESTPISWLSPNYHEVVSFIQGCLRDPQMRKLPRPETVILQFKNLSIPETAEDSNFFHDLLRRRASTHVVEDRWRDNILPNINEPTQTDPEGIANQLIELGSEIRRDYSKPGKGDTIRYFEDIEARVESLKERMGRQGLLGLPYPFQPFNDCTSGLVPGEVSWFLARSGVGKTWMLILLAQHLVKLGYNVLFISQEMHPERLCIRQDAMFADISPRRFRSGELAPEEVQKYGMFLKSLQEKVPSGQIFDIMGPKTIKSFQDYEAAIMEYRAKGVHVVLWDSPYLLIRKEKWENRAEFIKNVIELMGESAIPLVGTWQLNRSFDAKKRKSSGGDTAVAISEAVYTDSDNLFVMYQDEDNRDLGAMNMFSLKTRDGVELKELILEWDIEKRGFSVLSHSIPGVSETTFDYRVGGVNDE